MPRSAAVGRLTLLVNNANEFTSDEIGRLDRVNFDRQMAVGLRAPLFLAEAFAAQAPEGGIASVVNLLDQRVYRQMPRFFSYSVAKSALFTATGMLAQALAPKARVNAVAPGPTAAEPASGCSRFRSPMLGGSAGARPESGRNRRRSAVPRRCKERDR